MENHLYKAHKSKLLFQGSPSLLSSLKNQNVMPADVCTSYVVYYASVPGLAVVKTRHFTYSDYKQWVFNDVKAEVWSAKVSLLTFGKHLHYSHSEMVEHVCRSLYPVFLSSSFNNPFLIPSCCLDFWCLIMLNV